MEPTTTIRIIDDDAEFWLPPEFLTDDDFLVEKENKVFKGDHESNLLLFPYELSHGFAFDSGFRSTVTKPIGNEETLLTGLTRKTVRSTPEDDFSGGFCGNQAFPAGNDAKAWSASHSPQSTLCGRRNQNCQTRVSSEAAAWDLYCTAVEELAMMNVNDESYGYNNNNLSGRGILDLPRKHPLAAAKIPNDGSGFYSRQSLQYQKIQAIQFQQLKQQQLIKQHRQLVQQQSRGLGRVNNNNNKVGGVHVDLSPSAWSNQPQRRDGSAMRAVFLGNRTGKTASTGTGVFLPRRVNHTSSATAVTREKSALATVLVPARVAQVLNLDESVVQPSVRSSPSLNDVSWRQRSYNGGFSSQMKIEQPVNEPRLPSDWAY